MVNGNCERLMNALVNPYYLVLSVIYLLLRILEALHINTFTLLYHYGTDLICMPLVLGLILFIGKKIKHDLRILPISGILLVTVYWAFYFEFYLPSKSSNYTGDVIDLAMYLIGMSAFILWQFRIKNQVQEA